MPLPSLTVDEIVESLKRSSLPTIIVEGKDDVAIYRWINEQIGIFQVDILPCTGRENLLKVYNRKNEFSNLDTIFIADKDMWVFTTIPEEYQGIIFTEGYSIENDLYAGTISKIESLIEESKRKEYINAIYEVNKWFAFEVEKYLIDEQYSLEHNIREILDKDKKTLCSSFLDRKQFSMPSLSLVEELNGNYSLKLRGKTLLSILELYLQDKGYKRHQILETIVKISQNHEYIDRLMREIKSNLYKAV